MSPWLLIRSVPFLWFLFFCLSLVFLFLFFSWALPGAQPCEPAGRAFRAKRRARPTTAPCRLPAPTLCWPSAAAPRRWRPRSRRPAPSRVASAVRATRAVSCLADADRPDTRPATRSIADIGPPREAESLPHRNCPAADQTAPAPAREKYPGTTNTVSWYARPSKSLLVCFEQPFRNVFIAPEAFLVSKNVNYRISQKGVFQQAP